MKMNESGQYDVGDGKEMFIEDIETGEKMVFILDPKEKVVLRLLLEEDIKPAINLCGLSRSEKRKKMRILWDEVPKPNSQNYVFVAEQIVGDNSDKIYEKDRELIGFGIRDESGINMNLYKEEEKSEALLKMVERLAEYYGIKGNPYLLTV